MILVTIKTHCAISDNVSSLLELLAEPEIKVQVSATATCNNLTEMLGHLSQCCKLIRRGIRIWSFHFVVIPR